MFATTLSLAVILISLLTGGCGAVCALHVARKARKRLQARAQRLRLRALRSAPPVVDEAYIAACKEIDALYPDSAPITPSDVAVGYSTWQRGQYGQQGNQGWQGEAGSQGNQGSQGWQGSVYYVERPTPSPPPISSAAIVPKKDVLASLLGQPFNEAIGLSEIFRSMAPAIGPDATRMDDGSITLEYTGSGSHSLLLAVPATGAAVYFVATGPHEFRRTGFVKTTEGAFGLAAWLADPERASDDFPLIGLECSQ